MFKPTFNALIKNWLNRAWFNASYKQFDDLHIDLVEPSVNQENWFSFGVDCLLAANKIKLKERIPLIVGLAFSLRSGGQPIGVNFSSLQEFNQELNNTPPSLYLLEIRFLERSIFQKVSLPNIEFLPETLDYFYVEYQDDADSDHRRSLWLFQVDCR
ncbi:MAG: hypothetical protein HQM08_30180 [Candidatus Riflebacteria bacterium]|nr:hypothetical protein [Candidatus Riflebacteria bacterium]